MSDSKRTRDSLDGLSGGIFLIGLGLLIWAHIGFFPWILALIGLTSLPSSIAHKGLWAGLQGAVWMIGLAVLFATDLLWPGVLILIGLSMIAGALVRPPALEKSKRKRGLSPEDLDDPDDQAVEY